MVVVEQPRYDMGGSGVNKLLKGGKKIKYSILCQSIGSHVVVMKLGTRIL